MAWWLPVLGLGVVTAALAYVTGIAATRRLGSRLASFVALTEVLAALGFAWVLLGQAPRSIQLLGGALVLLGVVIVKSGERADLRLTAARDAIGIQVARCAPEGACIEPPAREAAVTIRSPCCSCPTTRRCGRRGRAGCRTASSRRSTSPPP